MTGSLGGGWLAHSWLWLSFRKNRIPNCHSMPPFCFFWYRLLFRQSFADAKLLGGLASERIGRLCKQALLKRVWDPDQSGFVRKRES